MSENVNRVTAAGTSEQTENPHVTVGPTRSEIAEGLSKAVNTGKPGVDAMIEGHREHLRMVVSFFDKLVILNGGTLAITFSALFAFHNANPKGRIDTADLFIAWKLLIASTIGALLASWLNIVAVAIQTKAVEQTMMKASLVASTMMLNNSVRGPDIDMTPLITTDKQKEKHDRSMAAARRVGNAAHWLGLAAKSATIGSYYFLYLFAKASVLAI